MNIEETDSLVALVELLRELNKNQEDTIIEDDPIMYLLDNNGNKILL